MPPPAARSILSATAPTAALRLAVARADVAPLRGSATTLPVTLATRVALSGSDLSLSEIDASVAGAKLRGKVSVGLAAPHAVQGDLDADSVDASALIAAAVGMPPGVAGKDGGWAWPDAPFEGGWFGDFTGALTIKARQFAVLPGLAAREFRGTLRLGKNALAFDDVTGVLSGGRLTGSLDFRNGAEGLVTRGAIALAGADVAALLPAAARPPITGALDLSLTVEGAGRSPQALIGSLHGAGKIALSDAAFAGLDPRAFDAVTRAVDQGLSIDVARISDVVRKALDSGRLSIKHAQGGIVVTAGQARLTDFTAKGADADLSLIGNLDLIDGALDSHLILSGKSGDARPDIFMSLKGPVNAPARSVDVSALTGWLTLRAVENEARRLKAAQDAQAKAAPPPPRAPPTARAAAGAAAAGHAAAGGRAGFAGADLCGSFAAAARAEAGSVNRPAALTEPGACRPARAPAARRRLRAVMVEHEQPDRGRQVAVAAVGVDGGHLFGQRQLMAVGDFLEALPERVLEADARFVTGDDDRAFDHRRFHRSPPLSIWCASRSRSALARVASCNLRRCAGRPCARRLACARSSSCRRFARLRAVRRLTSSAIRLSSAVTGYIRAMLDADSHAPYADIRQSSIFATKERESIRWRRQKCSNYRKNSKHA